MDGDKFFISFRQHPDNDTKVQEKSQLVTDSICLPIGDTSFIPAGGSIFIAGPNVIFGPQAVVPMRTFCPTGR